MEKKEFQVRTEEIVRDMVETLITCRKSLGFRNLSECQRMWLERQEKTARRTLQDIGVDKIVAIRNNGTEVEEIVIFETER